MSPAGRRAVGALGLLAGAGGWMGTWGLGVWLVLGVLQTVLLPAWGTLLVATGAALLMMDALQVGDIPGVVCAVGVFAPLLLPRNVGQVPPWRVPMGLVPVGITLVALLLFIPRAMPVAHLAPAHAWQQALLVVASCAAGVAVLSGLTRVTMETPCFLGLGAAGVGMLARSALVLMASQDVAAAPELQLAHAAQARGLGMRQAETELLAHALTGLSAARRFEDLTAAYEHATDPSGLARRDARVLRLAAQAMEETGKPAADVDAVLQRAAHAAPNRDAGMFEAWPGLERMAGVAQRARVALRTASWSAPASAPRDGVLDCFGGTWCVTHVELPAVVKGDVPGMARVTLRRVAPAVGDVRVRLEFTFRDWLTEQTVPKDAGSQGEFTLEMPVDMTAPRPGEHTTWLYIYPAAGGAPLRLEMHPGPTVAVGTLHGG